MKIHDRLAQDNIRRFDAINAGEPDPGRARNIDWFEVWTYHYKYDYTLITNAKGTKGEFELVVIRPDHFLIGGFPLVIRHPITNQFACFYTSERQDGLLREGSPTGPRLQPFCSRGNINRDVPLNPILVNFAAVIRLRRVIRQNPSWGSKLDPLVTLLLQRVMLLHEAVLWHPQSSHQAEFIVDTPDAHRSYDLRHWPFPHTSAPQSASSSLTAPDQFIPGQLPCTVLDRAFARMEAGGFCHVHQVIPCPNCTPSLHQEFKELPDLGNYDEPDHHGVNLLSELGAMMPQEKMVTR